ncbi:MAG TPA: hypothetical protein IAB40_00790 [Candidatus Onthocola stercoravium]|nr:hypothetical protein [Candidatus Onthocola stercoravium]
MDTVKITFADGTVHEYSRDTTFYEMSKDFPMENIMAVKIDNEVYSLDTKVFEDTKLEFINTNDIIGNKIYKAGLKFLFEVALIETFPELEVSFEHSVPRGMLGVVEGNKIITQDDLQKIKNRMDEIVKEDAIIQKLNVSPKEAIKYYRHFKEYEKADNIQSITDRLATLYKLHKKLNYFYSIMPYSTGSINKYELVYLGKNRIVLIFPTVRSNGEVPEYVHYANIIDSFFKGKKWLENLHMPYISNLNKTIGNGKIKDFIKSNELMFSLDIAKVVDNIISNHDIKFILIAGPSSSGKTTTNSKIASYLEALGYDAIKISLDDYFVNREDTPKDENGKYDFECLEAIDVKLFNEDLQKLLNGEEISLPVYNFISGKREYPKNTVKLKENSIFLIEGLHSLNDKITEGIDNKYKYRIYLSPFIPINIDMHNYVSTLDLRLLRRIVRDNRTRGYDCLKTIDNWQSVRNGEEKYIFPYIHQADVIINTALAYEVGVLKVYVEPLLLSVGVDSIYYEEARRLIGFLNQFFPIPGEYVTDDSILREFIGGKYND